MNTLVIALFLLGTLFGANSVQAGGGPGVPSDAGPPGRWVPPQDRFFFSLPPREQARFLKLLDEWSQLDAEQRRQILEGFANRRGLSPEQREKLRQRLEMLEELPAVQREQLRERMHRWQQMSPEEREKFRARQRQMREKAEQDLARQLQALGIQPSPQQLHWIRHFYFQKRLEIASQIAQRARELRATLPLEATEDETKRVREQLQALRQELETKANEELEAFARNPHPPASPEPLRDRSHRGKRFPPREGPPSKPLPPSAEGQR